MDHRATLQVLGRLMAKQVVKQGLAPHGEGITAEAIGGFLQQQR
jgi:hypothetical protein